MPLNIMDGKSIQLRNPVRGIKGSSPSALLLSIIFINALVTIKTAGQTESMIKIQRIDDPCIGEPMLRKQRGQNRQGAR